MDDRDGGGMKPVLHILAAACIAVWSYNLGTLTPQVVSTDNSAVYEICMTSHNYINGPLEEACGAAQDATSTEFICNDTEVNAHCWVEDK